MRPISCAIAAAAVFAASTVSAQTVNLTGMYRCIDGCRAAPVGSPAFVTQNGPDLNLVNEAGQASRAWPDVTAPATRIWADAWDEGAVYSPDAMTIHFDNGTVWQRDLGPPPPPVRIVHVSKAPTPRVRRHQSAVTHPRAGKA